MKINIQSNSLEGGHAIRGVGFYTRNLIDSLSELSKKEKNITIKASLEPENDTTVFHYPYFDLFFKTLPNQKSTKTVVTIHDVIPLLYPNNYPPGIKGKHNLKKQIKSLQNVDAIITVTNTSKKDIVRFLNVPAEKVHVIYSAANKRFQEITNKSRLAEVRNKYNLPKSFVLYVGDVNFNKNIETLAKACIKIDTPLVIVGKQAKEILIETTHIKELKGPRDYLRYMLGKSHPELVHQKKLNALLRNPLVRCLGFVPDEDMAEIFSLATVYVQPSRYEGFGLPVVEAMSTKTPLIVSKTQALVEVTKGKCLIAQTNKVDDFAKKIKQVITKPESVSKLVEEAYALSKEYTWENTAKETLEVYKLISKS